MSTEERVLRLENAFHTLVELARTQSERMDESDHRFERLVDEYDRRFAEVAEAQKQTEAHISVLAEVMSELGRAQTRTEVALTRTEAALTSLTERFEQYISNRP
jgi:anti-sigma-K factor RskA